MKNGNLFSKPYGFGKDEFQDRWKTKKSDSNVKISNTLSLNIVAYENPDKPALDSLLDKNQVSTINSLKNRVGFGKKLKVVKEFFNGASASVQNPFEFPRQSNGEEVESEIMQFRASQRLVNTNNDKQKAVTDYACGLGMDNETLILFLRVLSAEEREQNLSNWDMLHRLIGQRNIILHAQKLVDESRQKNSESETIMRNVHELHTTIAQNCSTVNGSVGFIDNHRHIIGLIFSSAGVMWSRLPTSAKVQVIQFVVLVGEGMNNNMLAIIGSFSSGFGSALVKYGKTVSITLMLIPVAFEIGWSIWKWHKGEISRKRAAKNIIDTLVSTVAGAGAGLAGFATGTAIGGPVLGFVFGGVAGVAGGIIADLLIDELTKKIFDLPKTQALENAYRYFGESHGASDAALVTAYRRRALIDHPDKGGSNEAFCKLQSYWAIIVNARGMN